MNFIKKHLGFILTMIITYVLGILLVIVQYVALGDKDKTNFIEIFLNSLIPTTITYVLGCVLVNIIELLENKSDNYIFNIITCLFVMIYAMIFSIYVVTGYSFLWTIFESVLTTILLWLNAMSYNEKYIHKNRNLT